MHMWGYHTVNPLIDILLYGDDAFSEVEEEFYGTQHHAKVGVLQAIIQNIL